MKRLYHKLSFSNGSWSIRVGRNLFIHKFALTREVVVSYKGAVTFNTRWRYGKVV